MLASHHGLLLHMLYFNELKMFSQISIKSEEASNQKRGLQYCTKMFVSCYDQGPNFDEKSLFLGRFFNF